MSDFLNLRDNPQQFVRQRALLCDRLLHRTLKPSAHYPVVNSTSIALA
jgi:hypothetical protein